MQSTRNEYIISGTKGVKKCWKIYGPTKEDFWRIRTNKEFRNLIRAPDIVAAVKQEGD